ncbi:hypothetical protein HPB48_008426 [Haemaphysalis longicornis]|uniref:Peptidase M13 N-terminal domain-containing protein n=1 Tax=Haemaphysalis longicornis TaxID=44386 RepID=A0A9J6H1P9_HAELO|nr:hypothetical protein HPB48_008426 [Haemaphysalis longicornis]
MWTDDAADEIISISTDDLEREPRPERTVVKQRSLCRHLLRSKFSFLVLATVTVLFAGLLPFVAFRAALLSSSQALFASQNSRPFRAQSTNSNRMPEQGVPAFDIVVARDVDRERSPANHLYTEHVPVQPLRPLPGDRVRPATAHHHNTPVAPDKLLPQVMEYPKPCDSKSCQREALNVSEQLDDSVSPCDDFYTHVCRRWSQRVAVPNGSARVSVDSLTQDLLTDFVDAAFRHYSQDLERVADLYNECRSHKSGDFERPLFDGLMRGFGNVSWFLSIRTMASKLRTSVWPLFKDFGDTNLSTRVGMFYRTVNEPALFSIKPTTDSDFPNETLISIGLPSLVMGSFLLPPTRGNYSYISEAMDLILRQSNLTHGVKVNVLNVEMTLARAMAVGQPDSPRLLQVRELPSAGKLKWDAVFRAMMAETDLNFSSIYVSVESMRYLYALQEALLELQDVEIMAYLGFRTKLVLAPLLRDDEALSLLGALAVSEFPEWHPSLSRKHYCLRFFERFEPALSLYAAREQIGQSMRRLRAVTFVGTVKKAVLEEMASLFPKPFLEHVSLALKSAKWTALMPDWVRAERPRIKYIDYFFTRVGTIALSLALSHGAISKYLRNSQCIPLKYYYKELT